MSFNYDFLLNRTPDQGYQIRLTGNNSHNAGAEYYSLSVTDQGCHVKFSYPYYDWRINGHGDVQFSPDYLIQSVNCEVTTSNINYRNNYQDVKRLVYEPGKLIVFFDQ